MKNIIKKLKDALASFDNGDFLKSPKEKKDSVLSACIELLSEEGYKVVKREKPRYNIRNCDDLIHLFYAFLEYKHPEFACNFRDLNRDRKIAKLFIEERAGINKTSKNAALAECAEIITTIFKHEDEFKFKIPLTFGILGQKNCGWITDKAIQIINKEKLNRNEERRATLIESYEKSYESEPDGFGDLNEILKTVQGGKKNYG